LSGYAVSHNRRHRRSGHLFQNRYKSILCQEDAYLLELVRYIHLNPVRAGIVKDLKTLNKYPFSGHSAIMGKVMRQWQDVDWVLKLYDDRLWMGRRRYRGFVEKGISQGRRSDLMGGGLIRSSGGWAGVKAKRKAKVFEKSDERILGDGDFVEEVLVAAQKQMEKRYRLAAEGYDLDTIASKVCDMMDIEASSFWASGKERKRVEARSVLCYWAVRDFGTSMAELSRRLKLSISGVSLSVKRGERVVEDRGYRLIDL
jgi:putative transposase